MTHHFPEPPPARRPVEPTTLHAAPDPGPYGPQPTNSLALAGFICSLFGIVPAALPLGIVGLRQVNRGRGTGKGLAIAAIVISACTALLAGIAVAFALFTTPSRDSSGALLEPARVSLFELRPGDCVTDIDPLAVEVYTLAIGPCEGAHRAEVVSNLELRGGPWPGRVAVENAGIDRCAEALRAHGITPKRSIEPYTYLPTKEAWELDDRGVTCLALFRDPRKGSLSDGTTRVGPARPI